MNLDLSRLTSLLNHFKVHGKTDDDILIENIKTAHSDLERAEALFNELTDYEAVDYASYSVLAARSKYSYLISIAKERNLKIGL